MYQVRTSIWIHAPVATCFDLARSIDAHIESAADTGERVISGRKSGLLELGEEVTWQAKHFGITQQLSSRITAFQPNSFFQDRMTQGAFRFFEHDHLFAAKDDGTLMTDLVSFAAPFGLVGWIAERVPLASHLRRFLIRRGIVLKRLAEISARLHAQTNTIR